MITVYSKANCPKCVELKGQLKMNNVKFMEVQVDQSKEDYDFLLGRGHRSVPQIYDGANHVGSTFFNLMDYAGV